MLQMRLRSKYENTKSKLLLFSFAKKEVKGLGIVFIVLPAEGWFLPPFLQHRDTITYLLMFDFNSNVDKFPISKIP